MPIRILIADDNASVRAAMRQVLESVEKQWEIIEAANGKEAIRQAQKLQPNLVILDLVMPMTDGLTASREIARLLPDVPVLMHTLYSSPQVELEAGRVGVRKVVPKSESRALLSAVEDILQLRPSQPPAIPSGLAATDVATGMRRAEDKIRELCSQLFAVNDDQANTQVLVELRNVLHRHIEQLRSRVSEYPVVIERRVRNAIPPRDKTEPTNTASNVVPITAAAEEPPAPSSKRTGSEG